MLVFRIGNELFSMKIKRLAMKKLGFHCAHRGSTGKGGGAPVGTMLKVIGRVMNLGFSRCYPQYFCIDSSDEIALEDL